MANSRLITVSKIFFISLALVVFATAAAAAATSNLNGTRVGGSESILRRQANYGTAVFITLPEDNDYATFAELESFAGDNYQNIVLGVMETTFGNYIQGGSVQGVGASQTEVWLSAQDGVYFTLYVEVTDSDALEAWITSVNSDEDIRAEVATVLAGGALEILQGSDVIEFCAQPKLSGTTPYGYWLGLFGWNDYCYTVTEDELNTKMSSCAGVDY